MVVAVVDVSPLRVLCVVASWWSDEVKTTLSTESVVTGELENPAVFPVGVSGDCGV